MASRSSRRPICSASAISPTRPTRRSTADVVYFAANQHINPTNVCILRKTCVFCSYARLPKESGAYRYTMDQVYAEAAANPYVREFHIVGGLDMGAGLEYYARDVSRPQAAPLRRCTSRRSPRWRSRTSRASRRCPISEVLVALRDGGTRHAAGRRRRSVQQGRARDDRRQEAQRRRLDRGAPRCALARYPVQRDDALRTRRDRSRIASSTSQMLRDLQDETGGFLTYIPLAYHPDNNELGRDARPSGHRHHRLRRSAQRRRRAGCSSTTSTHVKTHWIMVTPFLSQIALSWGVNDLEGTVVREKIYHEAGAHTRAGPRARRPAHAHSRRRTHSRGARLALQRPSAPSRRRPPRRPDVRVGRIRYINCFPVYGAIDRGVVSLRRTGRDGNPSELNRLMASGQLEVSVISAVEYARDAARYLLLPDLGITSDGPVRSVMLFSRVPAPRALRGRRVLLSRSSMTSVALTRLLFDHVWHAQAGVRGRRRGAHGHRALPATSRTTRGS